jgi:uncharacterized protein (TIGR00251 family)
MTNYKSAFSEKNDECRIRIHVLPNSSKSIFPAGFNIWRKSIDIKVRSEAKYNKANTEVINCIAMYFKISPNDISIISGEKNRIKIVAMKNVKFDDIYQKIKGSINDI